MDNKERVYDVLKAHAGQQVHISDIERATGLKRREVGECIFLLGPKVVGSGQRRDCFYAKKVW